MHTTAQTKRAKTDLRPSLPYLYLLNNLTKLLLCTNILTQNTVCFHVARASVTRRAKNSKSKAGNIQAAWGYIVVHPAIIMKKSILVAPDQVFQANLAWKLHCQELPVLFRPQFVKDWTSWHLLMSFEHSFSLIKGEVRDLPTSVLS